MPKRWLERWGATTWSSSTAAFRSLRRRMVPPRTHSRTCPARATRIWTATCRTTASRAAGAIRGRTRPPSTRAGTDQRKQGGGRHPWLDAAAFIGRLRDWGRTSSPQGVANADGDGAHAARLWSLLRAIGHVRAAVLDGGWARWMALARPTETGT